MKNALKESQLMLTLSTLAKFAYKNKSSIDRELMKFFDEVYFISAKSTQVYIFVKNGSIIISFRGTEIDKEDIKRDVRFGKSYMEDVGFVHSGFLQALREVDTEIVAKIKQYFGYKIYITGHSLGGAISVLLAAHLECTLNIKVEKVVTFGQPRVFSKPAAKNAKKVLGKKIIRYINNRDVVCRLPLYLQGFSHIGKVNFFDRSGKMHKGITMIERVFFIVYDVVLSSMFTSPAQLIFKNVKSSFSEHSMDNYLNLVSRNHFSYEMLFLSTNYQNL